MRGYAKIVGLVSYSNFFSHLPSANNNYHGVNRSDGTRNSLDIADINPTLRICKALITRIPKYHTSHIPVRPYKVCRKKPGPRAISHRN